jgi:hypothetical protein
MLEFIDQLKYNYTSRMTFHPGLSLSGKEPCVDRLLCLSYNTKLPEWRVAMTHVTHIAAPPLPCAVRKIGFVEVTEVLQHRVLSFFFFFFPQVWFCFHSIRKPRSASFISETSLLSIPV